MCIRDRVRPARGGGATGKTGPGGQPMGSGGAGGPTGSGAGAGPIGPDEDKSGAVPIRYRPALFSFAPGRKLSPAVHDCCYQKRYFSCLTLLTSRKISSHASSPKVVPTTSMTLPAVMAPMVPHWRSESPSQSPARNPAA